MTHSNTVLLKPSEIDKASEILVRAFIEDPMFRYLGIKTGQELRVDVNLLKWFCDLSLHNVMKYNCIYVSKNLEGVAAWIPPGKPEMNIWQSLSMLFGLFRKCGWHRFRRCLSLFSALERHHQAEMNKPHWLLSLIGVAPAYQGKGIGSLLLQPVLEQADREGFPCYLSTFTEQAVYFYRKHGFEILWQGEVSEGSPFVWTMKRSPRSRRAKT